MDKTELKHLHNRIRHEFLLTFFSPEPHYAVRELNGYVLVKQLNQKKEWEVAIYTKEKWRKVEIWKQGYIPTLGESSPAVSQTEGDSK